MQTYLSLKPYLVSPHLHTPWLLNCVSLASTFVLMLLSKLSCTWAGSYVWPLLPCWSRCGWRVGRCGLDGVSRLHYFITFIKLSAAQSFFWDIMLNTKLYVSMSLLNANCEPKACILLLNLKFQIWLLLSEFVMFNYRTLKCLKLLLWLISKICDCKQYICMHDLGHMVEHIPGLPDLILFLANDVSVVHDLDMGHALGWACVSSHLNDNDRRFV
jgi:hypothetical protein